jgi:hypothetical protein
MKNLKRFWQDHKKDIIFDVITIVIFVAITLISFWACMEALK